MIVTIDPGVHGSGFAVWDHETLIGVHYGTCIPAWADDVTHVVIEIPQIYPGWRAADPNDLIRVAFEAGRLSAGYEVKTILPRHWKGNMKKALMLEKIVSKLTDQELACLKDLKLPKSKEKEVVDALGIGLWCLKRP